MALILKRGEIPATPHTEFYAKPGVLALEEIHGTLGFSGAWSRKLHLRSYPTEQSAPPRRGSFDLRPRPAPARELQPYHIRTGRIPYGGDAIRGRRPLVFGPATVVSVSKPAAGMPKDAFFRNGEFHEAYYCQEGSGRFLTEYGTVPFQKERYVLVPKGTTYRVELDSPRAFFLVIESRFPITWPGRHLNRDGQATLMAPVVETEIATPEFQPPVDRRGRFFIDCRHDGGRITRLTLGHHPFDLAGWEGALYPFGFDIKNHHGIAREIHAAPPMHQTFESGSPPHSGFALCSFVPQMEGWHPKEIPAPYAHYNVDSDEVMFFANTAYGARKGVIADGALTFHPGSLPHGPQGKAALLSTRDRGKMSRRLAVMLDTFFESLAVTDHGWRYRDPGYPLSWHKAAAAPEPAHGT